MDNSYAYFNIFKVHVMQILKSSMFSNIIPTNIVEDMIRAKSNARLKPLKLTMFASSPNITLQEFGAEQACLFLKAPITPATYAKKDLREQNLFYNLIRVGESFAALSPKTSSNRLFSTVRVEALLLRCDAQLHYFSKFTFLFTVERR